MTADYDWFFLTSWVAFFVVVYTYKRRNTMGSEGSRP